MVEKYVNKKVKKVSTVNLAHSEIGGRIRQAIDASGLKDSEVAKLMGIDKSTLSKYISGKIGFSYEIAQKVVKYTNCDPSYLLTGKPFAPPNSDTDEKSIVDCNNNVTYDSSIPQILEEAMDRIKILERLVTHLESQLEDKNEIIRLLKGDSVPAKKPKAQGD